MAFLSRIKIKSQIDKKKKRKLKCRLSSRRTNIINQKKEKRGKSENYEKEDKEEKRERARENTVTTIILVNKERKKKKKKQHEANNNSNKDYTKPKKCDWRHSKPAVHSLFYLELFIVGASTPPAGARTPLRPWALLVQEQWSRFSLLLFVILIFVYFLTFFFFCLK